MRIKFDHGRRHKEESPQMFYSFSSSICIVFFLGGEIHSSRSLLIFHLSRHKLPNPDCSVSGCIYVRGCLRTPKLVGPSYRSTCSYTYILILCGLQFCSRRYIRYTFRHKPGASELKPGSDESIWKSVSYVGEVECGNLRESLVETYLNFRVRKIRQPSLCS